MACEPNPLTADLSQTLDPEQKFPHVPVVNRLCVLFSLPVITDALVHFNTNELSDI